MLPGIVGQDVRSLFRRPSCVLGRRFGRAWGVAVVAVIVVLVVVVVAVILARVGNRNRNGSSPGSDGFVALKHVRRRFSEAALDKSTLCWPLTA